MHIGPKTGKHVLLENGGSLIDIRRLIIQASSVQRNFSEILKGSECEGGVVLQHQNPVKHSLKEEWFAIFN